MKIIYVCEGEGGGENKRNRIDRKEARNMCRKLRRQLNLHISVVSARQSVRCDKFLGFSSKIVKKSYIFLCIFLPSYRKDETFFQPDIRPFAYIPSDDLNNMNKILNKHNTSLGNCISCNWLVTTVIPYIFLTPSKLRTKLELYFQYNQPRHLIKWWGLKEKTNTCQN